MTVTDRTGFDLVVRSRRVALPDRLAPAAVCVTGGRIAAVLGYDAPAAAARECDLGDLALLPGLVDTHVHVNEPGRTAWEGFGSATRAAALGGVTTLIDMPLNSIPPTTTLAGLAAKRDAARGRCHVDVGFWGGAIPDNLDQFGPLHQAGVFGFKCFLADSGVPEFPALDAAGLEAACRRLAGLDGPGGLLIVHAEDAGLLAAAGAAPPGPGYGPFLASRPDEAETAAIAAVLSAARRTGARVHIVHLSSAAPLP